MPKTIIDKDLAHKAKLALSKLKQNGVIANRLKAIMLIIMELGKCLRFWI